jgi:hypothetical protein
MGSSAFWESNALRLARSSCSGAGLLLRSAAALHADFHLLQGSVMPMSASARFRILQLLSLCRQLVLRRAYVCTLWHRRSTGSGADISLLTPLTSPPSPELVLGHGLASRAPDPDAVRCLCVIASTTIQWTDLPAQRANTRELTRALRSCCRRSRSLMLNVLLLADRSQAIRYCNIAIGHCLEHGNRWFGT